MVGFVIQATGPVEFEDGLRTEVLPGGYWSIVVTVLRPGRFSLWVRVDPWSSEAVM